MNEMDNNPQHSDIIFYNTPTGDVKIEVIFNDETFWLTQKRMAELFGVESHTITYHLKEIYKTGELEETATARKIRVVQKEGNRDVSRDLDFYNLDAIIAVRYFPSIQRIQHTQRFRKSKPRCSNETGREKVQQI
jgi:hypothetical protein